MGFVCDLTREDEGEGGATNGYLVPRGNAPQTITQMHRLRKKRRGRWWRGGWKENGRQTQSDMVRPDHISTTRCAPLRPTSRYPSIDRERRTLQERCYSDERTTLTCPGGTRCAGTSAFFTHSLFECARWIASEHLEAMRESARLSDVASRGLNPN